MIAEIREFVERWGPQALVGLAAGVAAVAGSFAAAGYTPEFVVAPVAKLVTVFSPDRVVTFAITELGSLGEQLALLTAVGLAVGLLGAAALGGTALARRARTPRLAGFFAGLAVAAVVVPVTASALSGLAAGVGAALVVAIASLVPESEADFDGRREVLAGGATALGAVLLGVALGRGRGSGIPGDTASSEAADDAQRGLLAASADRSLDVAGIEPLVSENFYEVDINQVDPSVPADDWSLAVTGAVESGATYDYEDLTGRPAEHRFVTLRCVGENLNGKKMDTALWTGVPIMDLVEPAEPRGEYVMLRADDGYYEEFPAGALEDAFLAYEMNGEALSKGHGFPARVLVPGHWGEINVKWVTEIEFLEEEVDGYWEERGWHGTGPVETVAKLWTTNRLDDGRIEVGGHAYAGTRGIDRVEVSTDGGDTWTDAELSDPLPGRVYEDGEGTQPAPEDWGEIDEAEVATPTGSVAGPEVANDAWRQWVHRYDPPGGSHEVVVRATDGAGRLQPREETRSFPSGATGWVSKTVDP